MTLFEIKHRHSGKVLFSLETESLEFCVQAAVRRSVDLRGAELGGMFFDGMYFFGANFEGVDLRGASFKRVCLGGADLRGANLEGAHLEGADLSGAKGIIHMGTPNGWHAHAWLRDGWLSIRVGCREFRLPEARAYWAGKDDRREVMAALDYAEAVATIRQWALAAPTNQEAA